jgi:RimJ/RimL family protein N-acetyltransferase
VTREPAPAAPVPAASPVRAVLRTPRLRLEPLRVDHAEEVTSVLGDPGLYVFIGGAPPTAEELRKQYAAQVRGAPPEGGQAWRNWIVRLAETGEAIGFVQATITTADAHADVAWVIGQHWQGRGYATEAARGMIAALADEGVATITAHILAENAPSERVAKRIGLAPTDRVEGGERVWQGVVDRPSPEVATVVDPVRRRRIAWVNLAAGIAIVAFAAFDAIMARAGVSPAGPDQVIRDLVLAGAGIAMIVTAFRRRRDAGPGQADRR